MGKPDFNRRVRETGFGAVWANLPLLAVCATLLAVVQVKIGLGGWGWMELAAAMDGRNGRGSLLLAFWILAWLISALLAYGAHAAILYQEGASAKAGFGHFFRAPGGFGLFLWTTLAVAFRGVLGLLGLGLGFVAMAALTPFGFALAPFFFVAILLALLPVSAFYGLALPAAVARDSDLSMRAAARRGKTRFWPILGATLVVVFVLFIVQAVLQGLLTRTAIGAAPVGAEGGARIFALHLLRALTALCGSIFFSAILSIAYLEATEEGLTRPRT